METEYCGTTIEFFIEEIDETCGYILVAKNKLDTKFLMDLFKSGFCADGPLMEITPERKCYFVSPYLEKEKIFKHLFPELDKDSLTLLLNLENEDIFKNKQILHPKEFVQWNLIDESLSFHFGGTGFIRDENILIPLCDFIKQVPDNPHLISINKEKLIDELTKMLKSPDEDEETLNLIQRIVNKL